MPMLATIFLLGSILLATATDLLWHKIYNWTVYPGMLAALGLSAAGWGFVELSESFLGFLACGLVMLFCYVTFKIGGGDVKLIAMLGAFLGVENGIKAMLWTFVLGGCMGLILLIWRVGPMRLTGRVFRHVVCTLRVGRISPLDEEERAQLQPPLFLAPCALAAVLIVLFAPLEFM